MVHATLGIRPPAGEQVRGAGAHGFSPVRMTNGRSHDAVGGQEPLPTARRSIGWVRPKLGLLPYGKGSIFKAYAF